MSKALLASILSEFYTNDTYFFIWQQPHHSFTYCVCSFTDRKIPCPLLKGWAIKNNFRLDQSFLFEIVYEILDMKKFYIAAEFFLNANESPLNIVI